MSEDNGKIKELVLAKRNEGKVVFATFEGLMSADLEEFIKQPAEGILYDLNRDGVTVLSFINDPKWVNDFAVGLVITKLKEKLEAVEHRLHYSDAGESADLQALSDASAESTSQEGG